MSAEQDAGKSGKKLAALLGHLIWRRLYRVFQTIRE